MKLQWLVRALLLFYNVLAICSGPVQFPNGQSSGETRSLRGEPEAEPRVIHRQIKRLLLSCLLGRRRRSLQSPPQAQAEGRFFLPVIQSTNVHVNSGGGGGRPTYYPGQGGGNYGSSCNIPGSLGAPPSLPALPSLPSFPSVPSLPSLPSLPSTPGGDDGDDDDDDDDDDDTDDNSNVIPVTETNNEKKRRRRPTTYSYNNINRYLRPFYREVRRFNPFF
ncbi:unnamed protein product [Bemisia tabaci]|uniref:Uncharacterized protein n=1 Tax=Bemisia tabaci TaxID=7038 RepID=A0A9P0G3T3_BEMTA|nr:unnamed protein product [Bemisia tabaci]